MEQNPKSNILNKFNFNKEKYKDIISYLTKFNGKYLDHKVQAEEKNNIILKGLFKLKNIIEIENQKEKNIIPKSKTNLNYTNVILLIQIIILSISISLTDEKKLILRKLNNYETEITITTNVEGCNIF